MSITFEHGDVVRRAQAGDHRAFDFLVAFYRKRLTRLIVHYTRNYWDAEDIVQDTFVRAYRALNGFRQDSSFYTWICQIAINLTRNQYHSSRVLKTSLFEPGCSVSADDDWGRCDEASPEAILLSKQLAQAAISLVEQLPDKFRDAYFLREIDGLTYAQIAQEMNCPIGTVRSRIARTRSAIHALLVGSDGQLASLPFFSDEDVALTSINDPANALRPIADIE